MATCLRTLRRSLAPLVIVGGFGLGAVPARAAGEPRMMATTRANKPVIPPRGADGAFRTINHGIDPLQTLWHVRAALNVAALGCEGGGRQATIDAYNRFLTSARAPLAAANRAIMARYKAQYGAAWTAQHDAYMTSLYNFFSQPFVKSAFCAAAQPIAGETAGVTASSAAAFAAGALPRLEAPFTDFYKRYAAYELALASYNGRFAGGWSPGAPPPVSPLLDYAALDLGGDWPPRAEAAVAVSQPKPPPVSVATVTAPPAAARYARPSFLVAASPEPKMPPALRTALGSSTAQPAPALDYQLPN